MMVTIFDQEYPAFMDTGSPLSFIGSLVITDIAHRAIEIIPCERKISFLRGQYTCTKQVNLPIVFGEYKIIQTFYYLPGAIQTVLLGRDFLAPTLIGIHVGLGGYSIGSKKDKIHSFSKDATLVKPIEAANVNSRIMFPSEDTSNSIIQTLEEFDREFNDLVGFTCEASVLAEWHMPSMEDNHNQSNEVEEEPLYPDRSDFLKIPSSLHPEEKEKLREIMEEFLPMFTKILGHCVDSEHSIDTGGHPPISARLRPMNRAKQEIFDKTFFELLDLGIIEPANSPWSSCGFVVPKKDGSFRFVVDFKPLNKITRVDTYPIPRIDDIIKILGGSKYASTFDLSKGFFQIAMRMEDRDKTTFISHHGSYRFKYMAMGLCNAPATFQRTVDKVLGEIKWKFANAYFDDIMTYSKSMNQHYGHLQETLRRIMKSGMTIHPNKIQLCRTKFKILGFVIDNGEVQPDPDKVERLKSYPIPQSPKDIQRFLGLVGFYRRFIERFADLAKPLTSLIKKGVEFEWSPEAQESFDSLRNALIDYTMVYLPDLNKPFIIQTDASNTGLGAILLQEIDEVRRPIWFASRALRSAETRYSTSEKECLAVIWALDKFRDFIEYTTFVIETDHQALSWLQKIKEPAGRLARWFMTLQMYNFTIKYRPGDSPNMRGADALSRTNLCGFTTTEDEDNLPTRAEMITAQQEDETLGAVIKYLHEGKFEEACTQRESKVRALARLAAITDDGLLMRYVGPKGKPWEHESLHYRLWIPNKLSKCIISIFHDELLAGHLGIRKTYRKLEDRVYWYGMQAETARYIRSCEKCQLSRLPPLIPAVATSTLPESPWEVVSIDLMGPYPKGSNQNIFMLVAVDNFSKYVEMYPLRKATSSIVIKHLWSLCCRWGIPKTFISDNGRQFISHEFKNWCESLGIKNFFISAYHPQANMTERYIATIKRMIVATSVKIKNWDQNIEELCFALRTCVNDSTGKTPVYINTGREFRTPFDNKLGLQLSLSHDETCFSDRMSLIHSIVRDEILNSQDVYLKAYNQKTKPRQFKVGDLVLLKSHFLSDASKGFSAKLANKREGPFRVVCVVSSNVFDLENLETQQFVSKVHANELSDFFSRDAEQMAAPKISGDPRKDHPGGADCRFEAGAPGAKRGESASAEACEQA